ncbi:hypothetical protein EXIGLDRAFT_722126 [Exidia glandulosa HHB12029]|uniref:Uncharacterized protein n=1 Tax=Exidia glandulosa HHB12029 TaxID=1314781 RepID=A0A165FGC5_EXIGL|nr:hypothetical protein EXIGLDRAFT_722126 [Exidia glandulosa HHB12029]
MRLAPLPVIVLSAATLVLASPPFTVLRRTSHGTPCCYCYIRGNADTCTPGPSPGSCCPAPVEATLPGVQW